MHMIGRDNTRSFVTCSKFGNSGIVWNSGSLVRCVLKLIISVDKFYNGLGK